VTRFVAALGHSSDEEITYPELIELLKVHPTLPSIEDLKAAYLALDSNLVGSFGVQDIRRLTDDLGLSVETDTAAICMRWNIVRQSYWFSPFRRTYRELAQHVVFRKFVGNC